MPDCPVCENDLNYDDFGLIDCKSCGAVCSVDMDGHVKVQSEEDTAPLEAHEVDSGEDLEESLDYYQEQEIGVDDDAAPAGGEVEAIQQQPIEEPLDYLQEQGVVEDEPVEQELVEDIEAESFSDYALEDEVKLEESAEVIEEAVRAEAALAPMIGEDFLKELELFTGESNGEAMDHVYYDLRVSGVESSEDRRLVVEYLADERLGLTEDYVSSLLGEENHFVVPQLSFLRLSVVYKRLLDLDLNLSWILSDEQQPVAEEFVEEESGEDYEEAYSEDEL